MTHELPSFERGIELQRVGRLAEAEAVYRELMARQDDPRVPGMLGVICQQTGRWAEADGYLRNAIQLDPKNPVHYHSLGRGLASARQLGDAIEAYRMAITLRPDFTLAHADLALAYREGGEIELAIGSLQRALSLQADPRFASNLLYTMHFYAGCDLVTLAAAHAKWREAFAKPLVRLIRPHSNDTDPERKLKIGFVLSELGDHPVMRFLLTYLEAADVARYEFFCYCDKVSEDVISERGAARFVRVRNMNGVRDEEYAQRVREDGIDILFETSMHTGKHRLLVFARKPAPVQVTWLAYASTTGLDTIDYRLSDPHLDPPGGHEAGYNEKTVRLETYWCYLRPPEAPDVAAPPALASGVVTFGSLNSYSKANGQTLALWSRVLREVPGSRLLLYCPDESTKRRAATHLRSNGVDPARLACVGRMRLGEYFAHYREVDIGLDPFPYPGGTTTCDALWMGVPVVTLTGVTAVSRGGKSILSTVGLPELVAHTEEEYVRVAKDLAPDLPRLASLRASLRSRMSTSVLMNGPRFAQRFEANLREMWKAWCRGAEVARKI